MRVITEATLINLLNQIFTQNQLTYHSSSDRKKRITSIKSVGTIVNLLIHRSRMSITVEL